MTMQLSMGDATVTFVFEFENREESYYGIKNVEVVAKIIVISQLINLFFKQK